MPYEIEKAALASRRAKNFTTHRGGRGRAVWDAHERHLHGLAASACREAASASGNRTFAYLAEEHERMAKPRVEAVTETEECFADAEGKITEDERQLAANVDEAAEEARAFEETA